MNALEKPRRRCPICGKPRNEEFRPFCSKRCKNVDLHRWLGGHYAIPVVEEDGGRDGDDATSADPGQALPRGEDD